MTDEPVLIPVAICESCWLVEHTRWEPFSMDDNGNVLMHLKGVDVPEKVNDGSVEVCAQCGQITVAGIYEFRGADRVHYTNDDIPPEVRAVFDEQDRLGDNDEGEYKDEER